MSDTEETRARAAVHRALFNGDVDGASCHSHPRSLDRSQCDRLVRLILEHERVLADMRQQRGHFAGVADKRLSQLEDTARERDALASQCEQARAEKANAEEWARIAEADRDRAADASTALASQLSEARVRVERLAGALTNVQRFSAVPPVPADTPAHLVPNYRGILASIGGIARAALEGTGRAT